MPIRWLCLLFCELNVFLMGFIFFFFLLNKGAVCVHKSLNIATDDVFTQIRIELSCSEIYVAQYQPNYAFAKRCARTIGSSSTQHDPTPTTSTHPTRNVFLFIKHARQIPIRFKSSPRPLSIIMMTFNFTAT